jgi:hypothetical protein
MLSRASIGNVLLNNASCCVFDACSSAIIENQFF